MIRSGDLVRRLDERWADDFELLPPGASHKRTSVRYNPGVTRLLNPPRPAAVRLDPGGTPCYLQAHPLVGDLQAVQKWIVEVDWWDNPVSREYWRVLLRGRLLCEIYREREQDAWFVERIYD